MIFESNPIFGIAYTLFLIWIWWLLVQYARKRMDTPPMWKFYAVFMGFFFVILGWSFVGWIDFILINI